MKINKNILVLGYFGFTNDQLDGQTVKTRNILNLLNDKIENSEEKISYFDTQQFKESRLLVFRMFKSIINCDLLIYIPAQNNLKHLFPLIYLLCKVKNIKIHYIVVGGWLYEFLEGKYLHRKFLKNIEGIYPQTNDLTNKLNKTYGFNNVYQLNNFRINSFKNKGKVLRENHDFIRLVYMGRVHKLKGINVLFKLENRLLELGLDNFVIDIWGPIHIEFKDEFHHTILNHKNIAYKGVLELNNIYNFLSDYDIMLFPTKYFTEGFPGSILDAYISEIPVVASGWKYSTEFIDHNHSGIIAEFNNDLDFINKTIALMNSQEDLNRIKNNLKSYKMKYSSEYAWSTVVQRILK